MKPIATANVKMQSNSCMIGDAVNILKYVLHHIEQFNADDINKTKNHMAQASINLSDLLSKFIGSNLLSVSVTSMCAYHQLSRKC